MSNIFENAKCNYNLILFKDGMVWKAKKKNNKTFLRSLELDNLIISFQKNDVAFDLLINLSDAELKDLRIEIQESPRKLFKDTEI